MADKYEDLLLLGAAACCTYVLRKKKRKRRPRFWIHPVIANRNDQGDYQHLIQELRSDPALFRRYFRLSVEQFDDLLGLVEHRIRLMNTKLRRSIDPGQQLAICLRYVHDLYYVQQFTHRPLHPGGWGIVFLE